MAIDFPASPIVGQTVTVGGVTWTWDGVKWVAQGTGAGVYLPLTGGTLTGPLTLAGDPAANLQPATKQYVDALPRAIGDNRIINGDMRWDQRNNGVAVTPTVNSTYTLDRWMYGMTQPSKISIGRVGPSPNTGPLGFPYFLQCVSATAFTPAATDTLYFTQRIEADMVSDFAWGTANAQPVTLSFWANTTVAGTYGGAITNGTGDRAYPFTFALAGTGLQKVVVTIPGDTGGTWVLSGNGVGVQVRFDLGSGANFRGAAGSWQAGNLVGATGAVNICATNGATLAITGVKLEIGNIATSFNRQSLARSLADCQRYYQAIGGQPMWSGATTVSNNYYTFVVFPTQMRAAPTLTLTDVGSNSGFPVATPSQQNISAVAFQAWKTANATIAGGFYVFSYIANAEL